VTTSDELRANQQPAQGNNGFNPPSLLSIATGAPYFHNGAAANLGAIFDARFAVHLTSGNAVRAQQYGQALIGVLD